MRKIDSLEKQLSSKKEETDLFESKMNELLSTIKQNKYLL